MLEETLAVAHHIEGTFWEALKPLGLTEINVANPGQHVTDLIERVTALTRDLKYAKMQGRDEWVRLCQDEMVQHLEKLGIIVSQEIKDNRSTGYTLLWMLLTKEWELLTRDLDDVKARALSVNRGLTADNFMLKDALSAMTQESNQRGEALQVLLASNESAEQMLRDAQERCCEHLSRLTAAEIALAEMTADRDRADKLGEQFLDELTEAHAALREAGEALTVWVDWFGGIHDSTCPEDDTCSCSGKPANDRVEHIFSLPAMRRAMGAEGTAAPRKESV